MKKKFLILDGSSLIYRAFYALPSLTAPTGEYTNAIYGFSNMLMKLLKEVKPDGLAIAFDKGKKTFRNEMFAEYKGTRKPTPEELKAQIPLLHDFAAACGIAFVEKAGYEADDIIGTLATKAAAADYDAIVVTGDRDALQLVRENLTVMLTKKGISEVVAYDEATFEEEYQMKPIRLIDLKGLMGDTSDNIPGIPGVGPKTATKLLLEYGSLEEVLAHAEDVSGKKLQERIRENKEQAVLSKKLATIDCQVPEMDFAMEAFAICPSHAKLKEFCGRYELKNVWKNCEQVFFKDTQGSLFDAEVPSEEEEIFFVSEELTSVSDIKALKQAALSVQCEGKTPFVKVCGAAIASPDSDKVYFVSKASALWDDFVSCLKEMDEVIVLDAKKLCHAGLHLSRGCFGISIAAYLLRPEMSDYDLGTLSATYLPSIRQASSEDAWERLSWDAFVIGKLGTLLKEKLTEQKLYSLYLTMELPLVEVLAEMEEIGIYVDRGRLETQAKATGEKIVALEKEIHALAGMEFNINSPKQLGEVLFERLDLPVQKKTKTGYSTNAEVLEKLRWKHPIVDRILSYRMWTKLKSTYLDGIADLINEKTGRVHTSFNQTVTATGRLSSSDPNLQNIPVRTDAGKEIRALFEPGEGYDGFLSADYSQIELRLLAHMSKDQNFIDAFLHHEDVHARTAAEVFDVSIEDVTSELRRKAKAVNFGIVYGISDYGLSRDLHISRKEAAEYIEKYFARYPGVKKFMDDTVAYAHANGYVETMFGRKRELPAIKSTNFNQRSLAERMAMNTPIQGTAADIIKMAMISAYKKIKAAGLKSRILLQVHDELVVEVVNEEIDAVTALLKDAMEHVAELSVPLEIDVNFGRNWAEAK